MGVNYHVSYPDFRVSHEESEMCFYPLEEIQHIQSGHMHNQVDYLEGTLDGKLFWAQPLNTGGYRVIWDADDSDDKQNRLCSGSRILLHQRHSGCIQIRFLKFYLYYPHSVWYYHIYNQKIIKSISIREKDSYKEQTNSCILFNKK